MKITDKGRKKVESIEFALELRKALVDYLMDGENSELVQRIQMSLIAWAAMGRDIASPPRTAEERMEVIHFIQKHRAELNAMSDKCLEILATHDTGGKIN